MDTSFGISKVKDRFGRIWHSFFGEQSRHSMLEGVTLGYLKGKPTAALSSVTLHKGMLPVFCSLSAQSLFTKAPTHPHPASAKGDVSLKLNGGNGGDGGTYRARGTGSTGH